MTVRSVSIPASEALHDVLSHSRNEGIRGGFIASYGSYDMLYIDEMYKKVSALRLIKSQMKTLTRQPMGSPKVEDFTLNLSDESTSALGKFTDFLEKFNAK